MIRNTNGKKMMGLALVCTMFSLAVFSSCKKDEEPTKTSTTRTLTKSKLYDKTWYNQGSTISHQFKSDGKYFTIGTWSWINNSDTLNIKTGAIDHDWIIEWTDDNEMSAKRTDGGLSTLFKDAKW
jgi:hypothetical protein